MLSGECAKRILLATVLLCALGTHAQPEEKTLSLTGKVEFADGEVPVFATVTLAGEDDFVEQVATDEEGTYEFFDLSEGTYNILVHGASEDRSGVALKEGVEMTGETQLPVTLDFVLEEPEDENVA